MRACLRHEKTYLGYMLLLFFATCTHGHTDEAKSLASSYVD